MKVWAIFSIENEYNQPKNNLVRLYKNKPTVRQLNAWWCEYVDEGYNKQELLKQLVSGESVRFHPYGAEYRIEEVVEVDELDELDDTDRGEGGFGSTGI